MNEDYEATLIEEDISQVTSSRNTSVNNDDDNAKYVAEEEVVKT